MNDELKSNLDGLALRNDADLKLLRRDLLRYFDKYLPWLEMKENISFEALDGEGQRHPYSIAAVEKSKFEAALMDYYRLRKAGFTGSMQGSVEWAFAPTEELPSIGFDLVLSDVIVTDDFKFQVEYESAAAKLYDILKDYTRVKTAAEKAKDDEMFLEQNGDVVSAILNALEERRQ